jgi:hypothetical protein
MSIVKPNCFEKTKVRWGIFKKLSCTNVDLEHVRPLATTTEICAIRNTMNKRAGAATQNYTT